MTALEERTDRLSTRPDFGISAYSKYCDPNPQMGEEWYQTISCNAQNAWSCLPVLLAMGSEVAPRIVKIDGHQC